MQVLLDHLTAVVMGSILLMVLLTLQLRGKQHNLNTTVSAATSRQAQTLLHTLERDIENMRTPQQAREAVGYYDLRLTRSAGRTKTFVFPTVGGGSASGVVHVAYRLEPVYETVAVDAAERPAYRLSRYVDTGRGFRRSTPGPEGVVEFQIWITDDDGATVTTADGIEDIDRVRLELALAADAPGQRSGDQALETSANLAHLGQTIRPPNLAHPDASPDFDEDSGSSGGSGGSGGRGANELPREQRPPAGWNADGTPAGN